MIQLGRTGIEWSKDDEWRALQEEMRTRHCILLKDFLAPSLISLVRPLLTTNRFFPFEHRQKDRIHAREMRLEAPDPLARLLTFCLNSTQFHRAVGDLARVGEDIRYFATRCYKMFPDSDDFQYWHTDCKGGHKAFGNEYQSEHGAGARGGIPDSRQERIPQGPSSRQESFWRCSPFSNR